MVDPRNCSVCGGSGELLHTDQSWSFADTISAESYYESCEECAATGLAIPDDEWIEPFKRGHPPHLRKDGSP